MRRALAALALLALTACGQYLRVDVAHPGVDLHGHGGEIRVSYLARELLADDSKEPEGFRYYVYVLFRDNDEATLALRTAVAKKLLTSFKHTLPREAEDRRASSALLVIPVVEAASGALEFTDPTKPRATELLLEAYHYERGARLSRGVMNELRRVEPDAYLPSVSLVVADAPLDRTDDFTHTRAWIGFDDVALADVPDRLGTFEDMLYGHANPTEQTLVDKVRAAIDRIGGIVHCWLGSCTS